MLNDYAFGRHSNIPDCCIDFYLNEWKNIDPIIRYERITKLNLDAKRIIGYIPCERCVSRWDFVEIHRCDENCVEFLTDEIGLKLKNAVLTILNNCLLGYNNAPNGKKIVGVTYED